MVFWKKKPEPTKLNSDEYEELNKKLVQISRDVSLIDNRCEILNGNWRKLSAKVAVLNREMKEEDIEKNLKSDKVYLGS